MPRYYFDLRDGEELVADEEGMELRDIEAVQEEAARALANLAWDAARNLKGVQSNKFEIEARDHVGPVLTVKFCFEIARKQ